MNEIYKNCRFCSGAGCLACEGELERDYNRQYPNGIKPIATFDLKDPEDIIKMKKAVGKDAIEKAFSKNGGGINEILDNLKQ